MREIKFRGKRIDNGEWVYGYYVRYEHMGNVKHIIVTDWAQVYVNSYYVIPETVGQFTGLHDKNGTEIYEGDVVKFNNKTYQVEKAVNCPSIGLWDANNKHVELNNMFCDEYEVTGNVYENPEL